MSEEAEKKEPHLIYADRHAREISDKCFGPITLTPQPNAWWRTYWITMQGHGYVPYRPGGY